MLVENKLKRIETFDSNLFIGQRYFNNDEAQLYLKFPPIYKIITKFSGLLNNPKGLLNENFRPPCSTNKILSLKL